MNWVERINASRENKGNQPSVAEQDMHRVQATMELFAEKYATMIFDAIVAEFLANPTINNVCIRFPNKTVDLEDWNTETLLNNEAKMSASCQYGTKLVSYNPILRDVLAATKIQTSEFPLATFLNSLYDILNENLYTKFRVEGFTTNRFNFDSKYYVYLK